MKYIAIFLLLIAMSNIATYSEAGELSQSEMEKYFPQDPKANDSIHAQLKRLNDGLKSHPDNAMLLAARAGIYEKSTRYDDALIDISNAIKHEPNSENYLLERADIYRKLKRFNEALDDCDSALKFASSATWPVHLLKAKTFAEQGLSNEASRSAQNALYNMANLGQSDASIEHKLAELILDKKFKLEPRNGSITTLVDTVKKLAQLEKAPNKEEVCKMLSSVENSPSKTLWRSNFCEGNTVHIRVDQDSCTVSEDILKKYIDLREEKTQGAIGSNDGPERVFYWSTSSCKVAFLFQPVGFKALSAIEFVW